VVRRMGEADIREVIARPATVDPAERRATRGRVMAAVAPGQHQAAAVTRRAAGEATSVAEVAEVTRAAEVAVTLAVAGIPVTTRRAIAS